MVALVPDQDVGVGMKGPDGWNAKARHVRPGPLNSHFHRSQSQEAGTPVSLVQLNPEVEDSLQSVTSDSTTETPRL